MRRRDFLAGIATTILLPASMAQTAGKVWRIGYVGSGGLGDQLFDAFMRKLDALGHSPGKNILVNRSVVSPQAKAIEMALSKLLPETDILVIWGTIGGVAAKATNSTIPTVFLSVGAPVDIGLVESLSHPGSNMTGVTFEAASETYAKRLQMLKEVVPNLERIAVLAAQSDPNVAFAMKSLEKAASMMNVELTTVYIETAVDLPSAFDRMRGVDGLIVIAGLLTSINSKTIAELALTHRPPSCHAFRETVIAGGLISLGPDLFAIARQGAVYVDKLIQGANPADLPVEQPDRYEIYVNLKTAKTLALEIPSPLLARADKVIE